MSSILDIDLDYFNEVENPEERLQELLAWADRPIGFITEQHHNAYSHWKYCIKRGALTEPSHILHVDEHHDMMDTKRNANIANFMYHAMRTWKTCRVHWLVEHPIDSPDMWLDDDTWELLSPRFSIGIACPHRWARPDIVTICTSPDFICSELPQQLLRTIKEFVPRTEGVFPAKRDVEHNASLTFKGRRHVGAYRPGD
jgi:hypothetical protein